MINQYTNDNFDYTPKSRTFNRSALDTTAMAGMQQANGLPHEFLPPPQLAQTSDDWFHLNDLLDAHHKDTLSPRGFAELQRIQHEAMMAQLAQDNAPRPTSRPVGLDCAA